MKYKKIRGKARRLRAIEEWSSNNLIFDKETLLENKRLYVKFRVDPWSRLSLGNSMYPEPDNEYREKFIEGLVNIYDLWKSNLDKLNIDYYLKIWIVFPNFRESQVVCAIGDKIEFYKNNFFEENKLDFPSKKFSKNSNSLLSHFKWEHYSHEELIDDDYVGDVNDYVDKQSYIKTKEWFDKFMNSQHRIVKNELSGKDLHFFKTNDIWLGSK
ncbi:hypothetical protein [Actinobacillus minor]|uniref:hypothetical protein n=1 Tax=Actinobacillus minor TaxID=51047 RepID=UPI0026E9412C|nr:hypothetical protein [Actinobacillus minor]